MFTGIVETVGRIERIEQSGAGGRIEIAVESAGTVPLSAGASIAVNGCCLTVAAARNQAFAADLSPETLRRTSFAELPAGSVVNIERPLTAGAELGGHFVLGHVDGVGRIERIRREGENGWVSVRLAPELGRYAAEKGSLAIDGISLTIAACSGTLADFAIIPYTFEHTNLRARSEGDPVNLEIDVLARYIERLIEARAEPAASQAERLTLARLIEEGF
ncbi:MAG TPA: riboflavin synthase [Patescibacteria group bacterium]|nr:riboflavin synthase [Patescibacteria group bacterium]